MDKSDEVAAYTAPALQPIKRYWRYKTFGLLGVFGTTKNLPSNGFHLGVHAHLDLSTPWHLAPGQADQPQRSEDIEG